MDRVTTVDTALIAALAVVLVGRSVAVPAQAPAVEEPFARLSRWAALVDAHAPGERDDAADDASLFTSAQLAVVFDELEEARRLLDAAGAGGRLPEQTVGRNGRVTVSEIGVLLRIRADDLDVFLATPGPDASRGVEDAIGHLLRRGALLHADVAMVVPPAVRLTREVEPGAKGSLRVQDGRTAGVERTADSHATTHFRFGNRLIDLATAGGRPSDATRAWYRATSAYQLRHEMYGDVKPHLEHAVIALPDDPIVRFYSGALHEVFALPRSQSVVQSIDLPPGMEHEVGTVREELHLAEASYGRALSLDPSFHLAALHHGRVTSQLGAHAAARRALDRLRPLLSDRPSQYFAELFLGDACLGVGDAIQAREHYSRAAALYPRAQTPGLALSQLARERGARENAVEIMRRVLSRRVGRSLTDDPWWTYYMAHVADSDTLVAAMRAELSREAAR